MSEKWEELVEEALQELRAQTHQKELTKIEAEVFDPPTLKALSKLISAGHIDTLDYCISTGKEANAFRATTPEGAHVAVKIYRVHTSTFRSHMEYVWGDPRFREAKPSRRQMVSTWAMKEFKNLSRFLDAGCRVPTPLTVEKNVLLMEFIGEEGLPAPPLKKVELEDWQGALDQLVEFVRRGWQDGSLVHGDLSEYNVLAYYDEMVVIDAAQAVVKDHPRSRELLERDLGNLARYFDRKVDHVDADDLLETVLEDEESDDPADEDDQEDL